MRVRLLISSVAFALLLFTSSQAQVSDQDYRPGDPFDQGGNVPDRTDWSDDVPAHVAVVDGAVYLERDGRASAAEENTPLLSGDRLRTERGRVEVLFADGSALDVDEYSSVDLLSDALMRLLAGRIRLSIARATGDIEYRIDAAPASVRIRTPGDYRVSLASARSAEPEVDLLVLRGSAELANEQGRTLVRAGTHALATARLAPSLPYAANSAAWDAFDRWTEDQRDARLGVESTRYLPADLRYYGGLYDRYGSWENMAPYGYVWYPRVDYGWRPYYSGRWSFSAFFGWTWIGFDRWSWPTHHYGRWGLTSGRWYWIPDRRWAPAWVSWASAPGYVSWCPLGFDNRPVISIGVSVRRVDPWLGWSVLPTRSFVPNVIVARAAVSSHSLPSATWSQFVNRGGSPRVPMGDLPRTAIPRVAPVRSPGSRGGYALPQNSPAPSAPIPTISTDRPGQSGDRFAPTRAGVPRGGARPDQDQAPIGRPESRSQASAPSNRTTPQQPFRTSPGETRSAPRPSDPEIGTRQRAVPRSVAPDPGGRSREYQPSSAPGARPESRPETREVRPAPQLRDYRPAPENRPSEIQRARPRSEEVAPPPSDRGWPGMRSRPPAGGDSPSSAPATRAPSRQGGYDAPSRPEPERSRAVPRSAAPPAPSSSRPPASAAPSSPPRESHTRAAPPPSGGGQNQGQGQGQARRRGGGG